MESVGDRCRQDRNSNSSNHLRELLRLREDEAGIGNANGNGRNFPARTLGSVLYAEKRNLSNRTLLDIIREDSSNDNKKTWKHFKDKLRLKRAGAAWTSSVHVPASDVPMQPNTSSSSSMNNRIMMRRHSTRIPLSDPDSTQNPATNGPPMLHSAESSGVQNVGDSAAAGEPPEIASEEEEEGMGETAEGDGEGGPVRMSLMALLAETDREMGIEGLYDDDEEEEEEEESGGGNGENGGSCEYNNCCVCMVRHKGAALIPCGHTFCRLCSRELWVQRGNCPLCNGYILEILDIF